MKGIVTTPKIDGRYEVQLSDGSVKRIKKENIEIVKHLNSILSPKYLDFPDDDKPTPLGVVRSIYQLDQAWHRGVHPVILNKDEIPQNPKTPEI